MSWLIFTALLTALLASLSCDAPRGAAPSEKISRIRSLPGEVKETSPVSEWDKTLIEARKEGKLILYDTNLPEVRKALSEGFYQRTGLVIDVVTGRGSEIAAKLISEHRNGLYLADAYAGGTTTVLNSLKPQGILAPLEPVLFMPEILDTRLWFKNALPWLDKDRLIMQTRMMPGGSQADVIFNTNLARREELVSWHDLLNPKFKGKMNLQDPTTAGKGGKWVNEALTFIGLDWDYMKALVKQEPFITRDERLMVEWVARGKHIASINPAYLIYDEFKLAGAPLNHSIFKETKDVLGGGRSGMALINKAPHPNSARLFINWYLSKEGQTIYARSYGIQSAREDVSTDHLQPEKIRKPGVEYAIETEEFVLQEEKFRPMMLEIFGPLLAK